MRTTLPQTRRLGGHLPFVAYLLLFVACIAGGTAYTVERLRRDAIDFHTEVGAMQARALEDQVTQNLNVVDLMMGNLLDTDTLPQDTTKLGAFFQTELRRMPLLRSLSLLNASGRIVASSNPSNLGVLVGLDDYLPPVTNAANDTGFLRIGTPWSGRDFGDGYVVSAQTPARPNAPSLIPVTRSVDVNGRTLTLLIALNPDYFINLFDKALQAKSTVVELLRYDGIMLLSSTQVRDTRGWPHTDTALKQALAESEFGRYEEAGDYETPTLSAFRVSRLFPLVVVTHVDRNQALQAWAAERQRLLWFIVSALLAVVALATLVYCRQGQIAKAHAQAEAGERHRIAALLNSLPANLLMLDEAGCVVMVNTAWVNFLEQVGQSFPNCGLGKNCLDLFASSRTSDSPALALMRNAMASLLGEQQVAFEQDYELDLPGGKRWFHLSAQPLREPGMSGAVMMQIDITARKAAEQALAVFNRDFESFLDQTTDFVYFKDQDSRFRFCSQTMATITGHTHWRDMIGKHDLEVFPPDTARIYQEEEVPIFLHGTPLLNKIVPFYDAQGQPGFVQTNKWPLFDDQGTVVGLFGISRDVTEQRKSEARLQLAANVFTHAREGIMITEEDGTIVDVNDTFTTITGFSREEVIGQNPRILKSGLQTPEAYAEMWTSLADKGHWYGEVWNRRKSGEIIAEMQSISAVRDANGTTQNYVSLFSDITILKEHERQLEHIAHFDALTNLPNRVLLADRLRQAMIQSQRRGHSVAVVYLDLDGFKAVNDSHGHEVGDALLIAVSQRVKAALREGDTLARVGGDEFVAVLADVERAQDCEPVLVRMLLGASEPVTVGDAIMRVSASMGVTLYPQDGVDADLLMRHADQAMYAAKHSGKNRFHLFDVAQDAVINTRRETMERIRQGLIRQEFALYYQPKVNMRTGVVIGAEALVRWQHPEQGLLDPSAFLPIIEDHAFSIEFGDWVINTALAQMSAWKQSGLSVSVSVNIGARQLQQDGFATRLNQLLADHPDVQPHCLQLEILETSALEDITKASAAMHACCELGVSFALDDFGTGYSSLTYLKRLPTEMLKIDQSFVRDMLTDPDDLAIVQGVISLAGAFHRMVIAEGVETAAHGAKLLSLDCELAQGYGIARPMLADDLPAWVKTWQAEPVWTA